MEIIYHFKTVIATISCCFLKKTRLLFRSRRKHMGFLNMLRCGEPFFREMQEQPYNEPQTGRQNPAHPQ